jgi:hypothetical protein
MLYKRQMLHCHYIPPGGIRICPISWCHKEEDVFVPSKERTLHNKDQQDGFNRSAEQSRSGIEATGF